MTRLYFKFRIVIPRLLKMLQNILSKILRQNTNAVDAGMHEMTVGSKPLQKVEADGQIDTIDACTERFSVTADKSRNVKKNTRRFDRKRPH